MPRIPDHLRSLIEVTLKTADRARPSVDCYNPAPLHMKCSVTAFSGGGGTACLIAKRRRELNFF